MIKPLKYQQGGTATSQEQLVQLFQTAAENAQVDPEQLVQKASEIAQDEEAAAQFMQGLQLCAQGDPEGIKFIKSLFQSPAFKKGGKIFEFICKHKKGGYVAGCGCKEDGGEIRPKLKAITPGFKYLGSDSEFTEREGHPGTGVGRVLWNEYNVNGQEVVEPIAIAGELAMNRRYIDSKEPYNAWNLYDANTGELVYDRDTKDNLMNFYHDVLPGSNRVQGPKERLAGMQNGGMMQRSLPFTVNSLGMENENPAEFEKKAIMMRQRPMYAKSGSSGVGESEKNKEKKSDLKYNGTVSHDSDDYMSVETVGPLHRVIRAAYNKPSQLDTIIYSKADRGYTSPYSNNEYWMDDAGIQKVDPMRWKRLNQGFDDAKNAELDALMDQAGFEQVREEPKKRWWLGCGGEVEKHQQDNGKGRGIIGGIFNLYNRFIGQRMPDTVDARDRRLKTWVDRNGVQHFVEDANVNGNFTTTSFNVYQGDTSKVNQKITTGDGRYRIVNLQPGTPEQRTVISRNIQKNK